MSEPNIQRVFPTHIFSSTKKKVPLDENRESSSKIIAAQVRNIRSCAATKEKPPYHSSLSLSLRERSKKSNAITVRVTPNDSFYLYVVRIYARIRCDV